MEGRAEPNHPDGLLAFFAPYWVKPEVMLTTTLWWLLGLDGANDALDTLVRRPGVEPETGGFWLTEVVGVDRTRTDLEYRWGDPASTHVVVEAKIGHTLHYTQLAAYRPRLPETGGLLVLLVPAARRLQGEGVLDAYRGVFPEDPVDLDVWTYDDVAQCFENHLPGSSDVAQFKGLVEASGALDMVPFEEDELLDDNDSRLKDILTVYDYASYGVFGSFLPVGRDSYFQNHRRYVALDPYPRFLSVGVGLRTADQASNPRPWVWLRVANEQACGPVGREVLERLRPGLSVSDDGGAAVPLELPAHTSGVVMIQRLRHEIEEIAGAIIQALDESVAAAIENAADEVSDEVTVVQGIGPIDAADLLDSALTRLADIELVVLEAAKSASGRTLGRRYTDASFAKSYWMRVVPFESYVAVAFERAARPTSDQAQPWAWLRISRYTGHAEIASGVLEKLYPDNVARDDLGGAVPIHIPAGASGPDMFRTVRRQLATTMNAIRAAILAVSREG